MILESTCGGEHGLNLLNLLLRHIIISLHVLLIRKNSLMLLLPLLNKYDISVELMVVLDQLLLNEIEGRLALLVKLSLLLILRHHVEVIASHLSYVGLVFLERADEGAHLHLECLLHACVHFKFYKTAYSSYV